MMINRRRIWHTLPSMQRDKKTNNAVMPLWSGAVCGLVATHLCAVRSPRGRARANFMRDCLCMSSGRCGVVLFCPVEYSQGHKHLDVGSYSLMLHHQRGDAGPRLYRPNYTRYASLRRRRQRRRSHGATKY
ncbi:hypothetical protein EVAR_76915_1 [Eumeta japonica]|uniref:Uncharacterized protein n=1 Tax=Eumeta variegata TaxID=151549 RepID=A0A4C1SGZ8_EUMVA|nr:hypothetical protein EVAR_76915_1 [Eumeta japonica]